MLRISRIVPAALVAAAVFAVACGGGGGSKTATPDAALASSTAKPAAVATGSPPAGSATQPALSPAASGSSGVPTSAASSSGGRIYTATEAKAIVDGSSLLPPDLPSGWKLQTDTVADNAAAAVSDPKGAASFERCGRLLGRTAVNQPFDVVQSFLAGETLSFFTSITA